VGTPAVVVAGSTAEAKDAVVSELLGVGSRALGVPDESYLVFRYGGRQPQAASTPPRPPRRVELGLPVALLTGLTLVDAPAGGAFGPAYNRILLDAAARGGGLLFTLDARVPLSQAELDFVAATGRGPATPFFACWAGTAAGDEVAARMATYRDAVVCRVPRYAGAPWFAVPAGGGAVELGRALTGWSAQRRNRADSDGDGDGDRLAAGGGARRRVPTAMDGRESGWEELLDRAVGRAEQGVRQALAVELANIHLRCVQDIVFGGGCAGMPAALDREAHALSLRGAEQIEAAITGVTRQVLAHVLAEEPGADVLARVACALRQRAAEDGPDLAGVLLVTSTSGAVAEVRGRSAAGALAAYEPADPTPAWPGVLPPLGVAVSASCYQRWRDEKAEVDAARGWLQEAVRGTELQLGRMLAERFEVVRQALTGLVGDAVDHGLLLV
jgi:hypothetical protein